MRWIYLAIFIVLILGAHAKESSDNEATFSDFTLNTGDSIDIGDYSIELIEIQSIRDGIAIMKVSNPGAHLDEQRAFLINSANSFQGGADDRGLTITVIDIFDENSAKVRVEYRKDLGTPRKQTAEVSPRVRDLPNLVVQKSFDKNEMNVGDQAKVTVTVKNIGTGTASDVQVNDQPPLSEFTYIGGYPPKIKNQLGPGESDSAIYVMDAVKEGPVKVPAIEVKYSDSKRNQKSNTSELFIAIINPKSKPNLELKLEPSGTIPEGGEGVLNVSVANVGMATAYRVELQSDIKPIDGLEASDLDRSYPEIKASARESFSAKLAGKRSGNYTIALKASFQNGNENMVTEGKTEATVKEREYKYLYYLLIIPFIAIAAWVYKRYREYKY